MPEINIEELKRIPIDQQRIEIVERKGLGHPDSMCDAMLAQVAVYLNALDDPACLG